MKAAPVKIIIFLFCAYTTSILGMPIDSTRAAASVMQDGEDLLYEASWSHIKIGTVRVQILPQTVQNGSIRYRAKAAIESYSGLPFVNLHVIAYSTMDSVCTSERSDSFEKKDENWEHMQYTYDPAPRHIYATRGIQSDFSWSLPSSSTRDTLSVQSFPIQDGISLLYFARTIVHAVGTASLPTVSMGKVGTTLFDAGREHASVDIDACDAPLRTIKLKGHLQIEGIFGLQGDFEGWFSDDDAAVPITARLKVLLGTIRIELKEWHRAGWQPPAGR